MLMLLLTAVMLVGFAEITVLPFFLCYSTGDVNGKDNFVGGFCGINKNVIANCYSQGKNCWN